MKALLLSFFLIPSVALCENATTSVAPLDKSAADAIKPFDRLGRNNVTIRAQQKSGGSSTDYSYRTSWGSYVRTVTSTRDIEVTVNQPRKEKQPLKLEFFFVIKGDKRYAKQAGSLDLPEGEGSAIFSTSSKRGQERWVYLGFREGSGERIEGWLVRALKGDEIVGIAASSPSLEELAAQPQKLRALLGVDQGVS